MSDNHDNEKSVNDDESDFEDFGGFEAAEPVIPNVAQVAPSGVEAGPSPWAFVGAGSTSVGVRPDLLCGQNRFPPLLDPTVPAVPNGTEVGPVENGICQSTANGGAAFQANFDANFPDVSSSEQEHTPHAEYDDATLADDILDGSFRSTASSHSGASSGHFGNTSGNVSTIQQSGAVGVMNSSQPIDLETSREQTGHQVINNPSEHGINRTETNTKTNAILSDNVSGVGGLQVIEVDELQLDETPGSVSSASLNDAQSLHSKIESQLTNDSRLTNSVDIMSSPGSGILSQRSHNLPLTSVDKRIENQTPSMFSNPEVAQEFAAARKESHDALNVVVDEYKALMKTSHLELQEASKQSLQQILKEQQTHLQLQNQQQEANMEESMRVTKKQMEEDLLAMIKDQIQNQKVEFEKFLQEEKEKSQAVLEKSLKEEREASQKKIQQTVEEERENTAKLLLQQKEQFQNLMKEEKAKFAEETASLLDSERKTFTEILQQTVQEERKKNKEAVEKVMSLAREEVQSLIQQQKQLDKAVRQRQMASLDIFLESARRQLSVLMTENIDSISQDKETDSS